jgi:hypothetical protein
MNKNFVLVLLSAGMLTGVGCASKTEQTVCHGFYTTKWGKASSPVDGGSTMRAIDSRGAESVS